MNSNLSHFRIQPTHRPRLFLKLILLVVLILSFTYFLKHLDLLKRLYTFYFWIAETQSWKLSSRTPSFTIQTVPASETNKYYLQNYGKKPQMLVWKYSISVLRTRPVFLNPSYSYPSYPSSIIHTVSVLEIVGNLLARSIYVQAMSSWIFYEKILWLTTRKTYWLLW